MPAPRRDQRGRQAQGLVYVATREREGHAFALTLPREVSTWKPTPRGGVGAMKNEEERWQETDRSGQAPTGGGMARQVGAGCPRYED